MRSAHCVGVGMSAPSARMKGRFIVYASLRKTRLLRDGGFDGGDDCGIVGLGLGGEAGNDGAAAADDEFFKVPGDVALGFRGGVDGDEVFVEGGDVVAF